MPGLREFLKKTMIFTAAPGGDLYALKLGPVDPIVPMVPNAHGWSENVEINPVFNWTHDPSAPAKITKLTALVRAMSNMQMNVCDSIEVERVAVSLGGDTTVELPLDVDHVVAKFKLDSGHIPDSMQGWWRLEANTDCSMAVVFAYELVGSGVTPQKVALADLELDSAFPFPPVGGEDPDCMSASVTTQPAAAGQSGASARTLEHAVTAVPPRHFVVVVFGFTTCKERADFEPGQILGAGRVYPHVMVLSSQGIANAEATIHIKRPSQGMMHDDMDGHISPLLATDSNVRSDRQFPFSMLPIWSNVFDYVVTDPLRSIGIVGQDDHDASSSNWMTVVNPKKPARTIRGKIKRESTALIRPVEIVTLADFTKLAMQGEFDNIHLAPGMIYNPMHGQQVYGIKMAPFCVHDCYHTHFRWGTFNGALPKSNKGFTGRVPYAEDAKPLVASNQTVKIGLTGPSSFRYFAKTTTGDAGRQIDAGTWNVFNHHGSAYALGIIGEALWQEAGLGVQMYATTYGEPGDGSFNAMVSTPAFYHRLRWTGYEPGPWVERLQILDLSTVTGVRS